MDIKQHWKSVPKTWKREVAIFLVLSLMGLVWFSMVSDDAVIIAARAQIVALIIWPILMFAAAAFGMDFAAKQWQQRKPDVPDPISDE